MRREPCRIIAAHVVAAWRDRPGRWPASEAASRRSDSSSRAGRNRSPSKSLAMRSGAQPSTSTSAASVRRRASGARPLPSRAIHQSSDARWRSTAKTCSEIAAAILDAGKAVAAEIGADDIVRRLPPLIDRGQEADRGFDARAGCHQRLMSEMLLTKPGGNGVRELLLIADEGMAIEARAAARRGPAHI